MTALQKYYSEPRNCINYVLNNYIFLNLFIFFTLVKISRSPGGSGHRGLGFPRGFAAILGAALVTMQQELLLKLLLQLPPQLLLRFLLQLLLQLLLELLSQLRPQLLLQLLRGAKVGVARCTRIATTFPTTAPTTA